MTDPQYFRLVSYNCFGWNNGKECCLDLLSVHNVDFLLIQEHWLLEKQFCQFDIHEAYLFTAICGMDSDVPLFGRPYGGCCIFYKKSLAGCVLICPTGSGRLNAIIVQLLGGQLLLIVNVYFPTDDGTSSSKDNLNVTLGELEGLLIAQQFDFLLVAGDFNTDVGRSSVFTKMLLDFADHHSLVFADLQFGEAVGWTFESHSGKSHSWIDHFLISSSIASVVSEVCTLDCVSNFSDHRPIVARCDLHLGGLATSTEMPSKCGSPIVWDNASNEDLQRYSRLVCQRLDDLILPDSIVFCTNLLVKTISKLWMHIVMLFVSVSFILPRTVFLFINAGVLLGGMIQLAF